MQNNDNSFFDLKLKIILWIWIINCIIIIFAKYSVVPDTYCYRDKKFTYCTGKENEKQKRNVDGVLEYSISNYGCKYGDYGYWNLYGS